MDEIRSYILRASAGIAFGATLVILAIKLPGGVADALGLGDAMPVAIKVSSTAICVWLVVSMIRVRRRR